MYFTKNKMNPPPIRYVAFQHAKGGAVYGLADFNNIFSFISIFEFYFYFLLFLLLQEQVSMTHLIITLLTIYEDMPHCLKIATEHYLGLSSVVCFDILIS